MNAHTGRWTARDCDMTKLEQHITRTLLSIAAVVDEQQEQRGRGEAREGIRDKRRHLRARALLYPPNRPFARGHLGVDGDAGKQWGDNG
jgi:hypothetical protein